MTLVQRRRALQDLGFDVGDKRRPLPSAKFIDCVFVEALAKHDAVGMLCDCLACCAANWFRLNLIGVFFPPENGHNWFGGIFSARGVGKALR